MFLIVSTFVTLLSLSTQISLVTSCPDYWTGFGKHCYRYVPGAARWKDAEEICRGLGNAHLVSIHSTEEFNFVYQLWIRMRPDRDNVISRVQALWIGLTDEEEEGVFKYTDGTPFDYNGFGHGEPNDRYGNQDYVSFKDIYGYLPYWNDTKFWKEYQIMCER